MSFEKTQGRAASTPSILNRIRISIKDLADARLAESARRQGPSVEERQTELHHFYEEYESLVEVLCDAANYGASEKFEKTYQRQREWMLENYPRLRRYVLAYVKLEVEDRGDAFEALFSEESLSAFLDSDDGNMISRILRTREALSIYGDHLRQLATAA